MSTPTKRRKKNDHQASPHTVRPLDQFFSKPKNVKQPAISEPLADKLPDEQLTDEQLARKLQAEWDEQDRLRTEAPPSDGGAAVTEQAADNEADKTLPNIVPLSQTSPTATQDESVAVETKTKPETSKKNTLSLQSATAAEDNTSYNIPFDQSPLTFDPGKYISELQTIWSASGQDATYALLTHCFVLINSTQSRIKIVDTLVNLLRVLIVANPQSLLPAVRPRTLCASKHTTTDLHRSG